MMTLKFANYNKVRLVLLAACAALMMAAPFDVAKLELTAERGNFVENLRENQAVDDVSGHFDDCAELAAGRIGSCGCW